MSTRPAPRSPRPPAPAAAALSSGALCRLAGTTRGALRVYERQGLLGPPPRSAAGYRQYPADSVQRLQAIRQLQAVGFSLREIGWLLAERDDGSLTPAALRRLARDQVLAIDSRIAQLQVVRELVAQVAAGDTALLDDPACDFLLRFLAAGHAGAELQPAHPAAPAAPPAPAARAAASSSNR